MAGIGVRMPEAAVPTQFLVSIVDDDPAFRDSLRRLLKSLGYAVVAFPSAAALLGSAQLSAIDCLVADVHMPAMTGIELHRRLVDAGHAIPTILITAFPDEHVRRNVRSLGVHCYLPKPLDEAALIDCLASAVTRGHAP